MRRKSTSSQNWSAWLGSVMLGATGMYFLDPERGRRRRALLQDQVRHFSLKAAHGADVATRDFYNRLAGMQTQTRDFLFRRGSDETVDDQIIFARVRAKLGRVTSHPHAIELEVQQGHVTLSGPILAHEKEKLLDVVHSIHGVAAVEDKLEAHKQHDSIPSLQGGSGRTPIRFEFFQENWTPAARAFAILSGGALGAYGLARHTPTSTGLAAVGLMFLMRGAANIPLGRLVGTSAGHRAVDLQKTIEIMAPPEAVFDVWSKYENFPHFMSHVLEVRDLGQQRSHWVAQGPMATRIEWDAILTEFIRPSVIAWKTAPGAVVEHAGFVRFQATENGTRVIIRLSYNPPTGAVGHGIAVVLGSDPKRQLDDDLMRMKSFIETGVFPQDAAKPIRALRSHTVSPP